MTAEELDQAYVLLSQALTRVPREATEDFLARLSLLLVSTSELAVVERAIRDAESDLGGGTEPAA